MDILGIGNALLDIFSFSDDETALYLGLHPNHAAHVSPERLDEMLLAISDPIYVSGGSASNAVKAASALGAATAFIGCAGTDDRETDRYSRLFHEDLASFGVRVMLENRPKTSGRCLVIHMPGKMKAVACAPGAASSLRVEQIERELISQAKIVILDGQVLRNKAVTDKIALLCRESRVILALDISTADIARSFSREVQEILVQNDAILFLNTAEAITLALALENTVPGDRGIQDESRFIDSIFSFYTTRKKPFPCIVEKMGENGARAWFAGEKHEAKTEAAENILDDTGAGDVFAGAFLQAFLRHIPVPEALSFANKAAGEVLRVPGTRLDCETFITLKNKLSAR